MVNMLALLRLDSAVHCSSDNIPVEVQRRGVRSGVSIDQFDPEDNFLTCLPSEKCDPFLTCNLVEVLEHNNQVMVVVNTEVLMW